MTTKRTEAPGADKAIVPVLRWRYASDVTDFSADILMIEEIEAVPSILDILCRATGMGFSAVARVTDTRWITCAVKDDINFGLEPGSELKIETTICHEIREHRTPVIIDNGLKIQNIVIIIRLPFMVSKAISRCLSFFLMARFLERFVRSTLCQKR